MSVRKLAKDLLQLWKIFIVILTPIVLLPLPLSVQGPEAACAYVVIMMAVYWITEALPIAVTSLLPIMLFPTVGLLTAKQVSEKYVNDTSMLFVGGLIVAAAIEHWNVHKRLALKILLMVGSEPRWIMAGLMAPTWFLSMWISNTATTAMMVPIANAILVQLKTAKDEGVNAQPSAGGYDNLAVEKDDLNLKTIIPEKEVLKNNLEKQALKSDGYEKYLTVEDADGTTPASTNMEIRVGDSFEKSEKATQNEDPHYNRMCKAVTLCIAYAANTGGIGSLTGTGPNLVMYGQLELVYQEYGLTSPVTFTSWMAYGVPTSFILLIITWIWLQIFFLRCKGCCSCCQTKDREVADSVKTVVQEEYNKLGPISFAEKAVIGHFLLLAILWITRDMGGVVGWGLLFRDKFMKDAVPAVLVSALLFIFPSSMPNIFCCRKGKRRSIRPLMTWRAAEEKLPWGVVLLIGGGFALASASQESGLSEWVGNKLTVLSRFDPLVINLILCYIVAAATEVTSNTATCTLMMPILANLAISLHQDPLYFMFPTALATSFAFMLPVATPPNAVVFSYGHVKVIDMVSAGLMMNILSVLVLIGCTETVGEAIFKFHTVPEPFRENVTTTTGAMASVLTSTLSP